MTIQLPTEPRRRTAPWLEGLRVQLRVIHALMLRDALRQHGHHSLGFFWIIGEPMFLMVGIMVLWSLAHVSHSSEVEAIPFALTGYGFITLWRHITGSSVRIMRRNRVICYHRQVNLLDVIVARSALETVALFTTFTICYVPLYLFGLCPPPHDPLLLVGGFVMTGWFSFGIGMILAAVSEISDVVHNVVGAVMYITLPLTGAFTMQDWLPGKVRALLAWSPLVNCIEMLRGGVFPESVPVDWSGPYLLACCCLVTAIGVLLSSYAQRFIAD